MTKKRRVLRAQGGLTLRPVSDKTRTRFSIWHGGVRVGEVVLWHVRPALREAELKFWVNKQGRRGHATHAVRRVVAYAFRALRLARLTAQVRVRNEASQKVLGRSGFVIEYQRGAYYFCELRNPKPPKPKP